MSDYLKEGFIDEVKGALKGDGGGSGQNNVIEKIKVNGVDQTVDSNKAVDIPVPTKTSELENDEGFLKEHQDLSGYAKTTDIPTVPTNVSAFTNDADYQTADDVATKVIEGVSKIVSDAPEDFDTLKEMSDWITQHEDSASAMNSAILQNKTDIGALKTSKADVTDVDEINRNLEVLSYGENAGGINLLDIKNIGISNDTWNLKLDFVLKAGHTYFIKIFSDTSYLVSLVGIGAISNGNYKITTPTQDTQIILGNNNVSFVGKENEFRQMQFMVCESDVAIDTYEPYIPSVKMLAEEVAKQNASLGENVWGGEYGRLYPKESSKSIVSNDYSVSIVYKCQPNTTYTIKNKYGNRLVIATTTTQPANDVACSNFMIQPNDTYNYSATYKTDANAQYIVVMVYYSEDGDSLSNVLENVAIYKDGLINEVGNLKDALGELKTVSKEINIANDNSFTFPIDASNTMALVIVRGLNTSFYSIACVFSTNINKKVVELSKNGINITINDDNIKIYNVSSFELVIKASVVYL